MLFTCNVMSCCESMKERVDTVQQGRLIDPEINGIFLLIIYFLLNYMELVIPSLFSQIS